MRTEKQRLASRNDGANSNGPVSPEGKAHSSMNAARHGAYAATSIIPSLGETEEQLFASLTRWNQTLQPAGELEAALTKRAAILDRRLDRLYKMEAGYMDQLLDPAIEPEQVAPLNQTILQYSRIQNHAFGQFLKTIKDTRELQKERPSVPPPAEGTQNSLVP